jgi:hypothetical protein
LHAQSKADDNKKIRYFSVNYMRLAIPFPALTAALFSAVLSMQPDTAAAQEPVAKSIIALVGDTDKFNIGQEGFCGERTNIDSPGGKKFRIPSNKKSFFYIRSKFYAAAVTYTCDGDFSFIPSPGQLYIMRYTMAEHCVLEVFESEPGGPPRPVAVEREQSQSCLFK